jgi:hypothetical protein
MKPADASGGEPCRSGDEVASSIHGLAMPVTLF